MERSKTADVLSTSSPGGTCPVMITYLFPSLFAQNAAATDHPKIALFLTRLVMAILFVTG